MVFNGEYYSADDLRPELAARGVRFRGHSDTEVILEAFAAWGVAYTLPRLIGRSPSPCGTGNSASSP